VVSDLGGVEIPRALSTTFYRIAEEALRNVEARADAGNALISLSAHKGNLELEVSDDGCAIDDTATAKANVVLANMRRRLSLAGGQLHIDSTPDEGTRVLATVTFDTDGQGEDAA
jgi:signal transduction histidine kinase